MQITKKGKEQVFVGKAKCKVCGTEFTYEDNEVNTECSGYSHSSIHHKGMSFGDSTKTYNYYVVCPNCRSHVKTQSVKGRKTSIAAFVIAFSIILALCIFMISMFSPNGPICENCGHRTNKISEYNQYTCGYTGCKNLVGTHYTYHCRNCWEYYHIVK